MQLLVLLLELFQLGVSDYGLEDLVEVALDGGEGGFVYRHLHALLRIKLHGRRRIRVRAVSALAIVWLLGVRRCFRHNLGVGVFYRIMRIKDARLHAIAQRLSESGQDIVCKLVAGVNEVKRLAITHRSRVLALLPDSSVVTAFAERSFSGHRAT